MAVQTAGPAVGQPPAALTCAVRRDDAALDELAESWDELVRACPSATPFQTHAWLASWWHSYGRPGRLRLVTVHRGSRLVALAPLMRHRGGLRPIGVGLTDFHDVLIDADHADVAAPALAGAVAALLRRPWAVLDLREVRADAAAQELAAFWPAVPRRASVLRGTGADGAEPERTGLAAQHGGGTALDPSGARAADPRLRAEAVPPGAGSPPPGTDEVRRAPRAGAAGAAGNVPGGNSPGDGAGSGADHDAPVGGESGWPGLVAQRGGSSRTGADAARASVVPVAVGSLTADQRRLRRQRVRRLPDSLCQSLPGVPMEELLKRVPGKTAQRSRVKQRKLAALGVRVREVPPAEVPEAMDRLLELHARQWSGRGATREHLRGRFATHLRAATAELAAADGAVVREYVLDDVLIAVELALQSPTLTALYLYGVDPSARERLDVAGMLFGENLTHAVRTGRTEISLLRGDEEYKRRWRPDRSYNERLLLGAAPGTAVLAAAARADRALRDAVRERAPWVATLRARLAAARGGGGGGEG